MLTPFIKRQLLAFIALTVISISVLGVFYLRLPSLAGIGQYTLKAELPASGGLYRTSNVTYRGNTIGKVTAVEPTRAGAEATMSIDSRYKVPADAVANVHSVSALGEQYLDIVASGSVGRFYSSGQTIGCGDGPTCKNTVPKEVGPTLDSIYNGLNALPKEKISSILDETALAVGGLGPALQRLVDATQSIVGDAKTNIGDIDNLIENAEPVLSSQVNSGGAIERWAHNLNILAAQTAANDPHLRSILQQAAPTADQVNEVFGGVRESLPQTLANLEVVYDLLKRYHSGAEQVLVLLPQGGSVAQTSLTPYPNEAVLDIALSINQPPPCLTGFIPADQWRSPADLSPAPLATGYCKIPMDTPANSVRGSRNIPCVDVPGKRAATPGECRSPNPYVPAGTNPWYGDPNQIVSCPAPAARCDQPVKPGMVIPAPSVNNGMNPAPPPSSQPCSA